MQRIEAASLRAASASCQFLSCRDEELIGDAPILPGVFPPLLHVLDNGQQFFGGIEVPGGARILEQVFDAVAESAAKRSGGPTHCAGGIVERNTPLRVGRLQLHLRCDRQKSSEE